MLNDLFQAVYIERSDFISLTGIKIYRQTKCIMGEKGETVAAKVKQAQKTTRQLQSNPDNTSFV